MEGCSTTGEERKQDSSTSSHALMSSSLPARSVLPLTAEPNPLGPLSSSTPFLYPSIQHSKAFSKQGIQLTRLGKLAGSSCLYSLSLLPRL